MCDSCSCEEVVKIVNVAGGSGAAVISSSSGIQGNGSAATPVKENFDNLPAGTGSINGVVVSTVDQPDGALVSTSAIVADACESVQDCLATALPFASYDDTNNKFDLGSIDKHSDVDTVSTPPTNGQQLVWNSTLNQWVPGTSSGIGLPTILMSTTAASTTIQPFPAVNQTNIAPTSLTIPANTTAKPITWLVTFKFGELRIDLDNGTYNLSERGNCYKNAVRLNSPADHDRRFNRQGGAGDSLQITTATKDFDYTFVQAAGSAAVIMSMDYEHDVNIAPTPANIGRLLFEPSTIVAVGFS